MRLLGYYAFHSFVNQVRKMLRTWVLIFLLVCGLVGGLIGFMAGSLAEEVEEPHIEAEISEEDTYEGTDSEPFTEDEDGYSEEETEFFYEEEPLFPIGAGAILELVFGAGILVFFVYKAITAPENGAKIFLPADTVLLFGSPLTPQAVLFFRLVIQMGTLLAFTIYMAVLQVPNLLDMGLPPAAVVLAFLAWLIAMLEGTVLSEFLYLLSSVSAGVRKHLDKAVYAILALTAVGFFLFKQRSGLGLWEAAAAFFAGPISRLIPLWGWVKAIPGCAYEGNYPMALFLALLSVLSVLLLMYASRRIPADFYEDASAKSAELAAMRQQAEEHGGISVMGISKKKKADVVRDGFHKGNGADVFFYKAMYNRWRFAWLHFFTKTTWFYLAAGLGMAAIVRFIAESRTFAPVTYVLGAMVFFRSLGNPLAEDTRMDFFRSIPESASAKIFYSLLGGGANCLLDLIPGLFAAGILLLANPLTVLGSLAFLVTIDFFSTIIGTFIDLSVPVNAGKMIKQLVQILFLYFGLLPDVACIAILTIKGHEGLGLLAASFVNILLGIAFFVVTPRLLEPVSRPVLPPLTMPSPEDQRAAGLAFAGCALALFAFFVAGSAAQILAGYLAPRLLPADFLAESDWGFWLVTMIPLYLIGVPCALLIFRMIPKSGPEKAPLKPGILAKAIFVCFFMMYSGNIIGLFAVSLLKRNTVSESGSVLEVLPMTGALLPRVLFLVILAPLFEELIFRKLLIDRTRIYGEKLAILLSGLLFGLFHGNLNQFFYATLIGFCLAYIYLRTGKVRYTILLHMLINLNGGIIAVELADRMMGDLTLGEALSFTDIPAGILAFMAYVMIVLGIAAVGGVFLFSGLDRLIFLRQEKELPFWAGLKTAFKNPPMVLFILTMAGVIVYSLFV